MLLNKNKNLILASQSPRRQELMKQAGFDFEVIVSDTDETYPPGLASHEIAVFIARQKAKAIEHHLKNEDTIIIAADTIVCLDSIIYGKPEDENHAFKMIKQLSGKQHEVITGVYLMSQKKQHSFSVQTKVFFKPLSTEQINYYIRQYQPYDKAGAYAIQEWIGLVGIEKIEGCYFNVVGLPISRLYTELKIFIKNN